MTPRAALAAFALVATSLVAPLGATTPAGLAAEESPRFRLEAAPADRLLPRAAAGRAAIRLADDRFDAAAAVNRMHPSALRRLLLSDSAATLHDSGKLFYRDDLSARSQPEARVAPAPFPSSQTFSLHSKPGSQRTIYLDFDGATVSGTQWNGSRSNQIPDGPVPGFTLDSSHATFNDDEHATIQEVWQRVSEDYAPFDVDVTTQEPSAAQIDRNGSSDQVFGTTTVITSDPEAHARLCGPGCTGIAFMDVFDEPSFHADYQPAWAFTAEYSDVQAIAETISHEVGHNFGLEHDGKGAEPYYTGHGVWTPIMGSGFGPVIQWSDGAYTGATSGQDDVALISSNGAPYRVDAVGGTVATAGSALPTGAGIIERRNDVDMYKVGTCRGTVTVTAGNAPSSPNLDILLRLVDSNGAEIASADPVSGRGDRQSASGMGASLTYDATGQTLFVAVDGVGSGTADTGYDDYGSIGQYTLSASGCSAASSAPGAPVSVVATATSSSATVSWAPPASDGGSAITGYVVEVGGQLPQNLTAASRSATFTGLTPSTPYTATVKAVNAVGTGRGATASVTTGNDGGTSTAPGAPRTLAATWDPTESGFAVSWSAPASDGGSPVTAYEVFLDGESLGTTTDTSATVTGTFSPGGAHTVEVLATNAVGSSPRATTSVVVPDDQEVTVPGAPRIGVAKPGAPGGARTVSVTWSVPASDGGSPVTGYQVLVHKVSSSHQIIRTFTPDALTANRLKVAYKVAAGRYAFSVVAINTTGESEPSAYSRVVKAR